MTVTSDADRDVAAGVVGHGGGGGDVHGHRLAGVRLVRVQYEVALHGDLHAVTDTPSALVCKLINGIAAGEMSANFMIKPLISYLLWHFHSAGARRPLPCRRLFVGFRLQRL